MLFRSVIASGLMLKKTKLFAGRPTPFVMELPAYHFPVKMLDYLDEYTNFHFKEEEKLQENVGYPGRETHHEKHEEFKKTIQVLYEYLNDYEGPTDQFSELVQKNVIDWLFGHIKTNDRSVAEFIFIRENPDRL